MVPWLVSPLEITPTITPETRHCPKCGYEFAHRHGQRTRFIGDWKQPHVTQVRMRCPKCGITWTVYPQGVDPGIRRSRRAQQFGVFLYAAGLSYRKASAALQVLDIHASPATILRDVQSHAARERIEAYHRLLKNKTRISRIGRAIASKLQVRCGLEEKFFQEGRVPRSHKAFFLDTPFPGTVKAQKIECPMPESSKVFCAMSLPHSASVFIKSNIQNPVYLLCFLSPNGFEHLLKFVLHR